MARFPAASTTVSRAWVRSLRPPKGPVDAWRPFGWELEAERTLSGTVVPAVTVFLAGSECPFTCVYCDLWRYTLDAPTPRGALPAQLRLALGELARELPPLSWREARLKLYNASNFFEPRAVPPADEGELAEIAAAFGRVVVECHPRLVGERCFAFAGRLSEAGSQLEVALGLETIHPRALPRLGKQMRLEDFDAATAKLGRAAIPFRAFVLFGAPFVPAQESVDWTVRSVDYALERGAESVSIIPLREGNGAVEALIARGEARLPLLGDLEEALDRCCRSDSGVAVADLWDFGRLATCETCRDQRLDRLRRQNLTGQVEARVTCPSCSGGACAPGRQQGE